MPEPEVTTRYAVLLRGVNVGGHRVAMPELRTLAEELGYAQVSTYINSGNLLLSTTKGSAALAGELQGAISERFGFPVPVMVRTICELRSIVGENPYPEGNPSQVTVAFLNGSAAPGASDRMAALAAAEERFTLAETEVYLDFAGGLGQSKLAAQLAKAIGVEATVRNIRTVQKLVDLLDV